MITREKLDAIAREFMSAPLYHVEMMLGELQKRRKPPGDTRSYLSLDDVEAEIIGHLLRQEKARLESAPSVRDLICGCGGNCVCANG